MRQHGLATPFIRTYLYVFERERDINVRVYVLRIKLNAQRRQNYKVPSSLEPIVSMTARNIEFTSTCMYFQPFTPLETAPPSQTATSSSLSWTSPDPDEVYSSVLYASMCIHLYVYADTFMYTFKGLENAANNVRQGCVHISLYGHTST